jgi:1-aminocyclopropane-1-carboxylate deaminase/D-cysteine desulfhydrase-like pyridoxal-dependent ACC family enzyme
MIDIALGETLSFKFTTVQTTGAPFALASGVISAYPDYPVSDTQITAGITLTADYDGVTGLNSIALVATEANGYAPGKYTLVITTGTVNSVSVVGYVVGEFTIQNIVAGVVDFVCAASGSQSTTAIYTSACLPNAGATDCFKGRIVIFDRNTTTAALRGQASDITANTSGATPTLTVTALTTAAATGGGDRGRIY